MVPQASLLVMLVGLIDLIPTPAEPVQRKRGRSKTYPDKFFLKALVIMIVRQVHTPSASPLFPSAPFDPFCQAGACQATDNPFQYA